MDVGEVERGMQDSGCRAIITASMNVKKGS